MTDTSQSVNNQESEKNERDREVEISPNCSESDEVMAKRLQNIEIYDKVTFIDAKHIPIITTTSNDEHSNSGTFIEE